MRNDSKLPITRRDFIKTTGAGLALASAGNLAHSKDQKPNIVWICVEDMSAHMSCYGETIIQTPNIDRLAEKGTRFTEAIVTCPVCSPSRSAMITGMYQTSIGAHNHRSSRQGVKIPLPEHIKLIPEYFQNAGYYTSNGGMLSTNPDKPTSSGKTDYNFVFSDSVYDGTDWRGRDEDQPFFAQYQLNGGKNRSAKVPNPVDPEEVTLPPYYPDEPQLKQDWANYLNSVIKVDMEVGIILDELEKDGLLDNTIIFFWTDHGISHIRDKQYQYEGGMHVPLIVKGPGIPAGKVVTDLVEHIDIPYTSLECAGVDIPKHLQGRSLFSVEQNPRTYVFSGRDRCDETVDRIRAVRTKEFKYIRNYYPERSHTQQNRYKDNKDIMKTMRTLYAEGKLNEDQEKPFLPTRPSEELYDLKNDPHELNNLIDSDEHQVITEDLRLRLIQWEEESKDLGQFPEPCLVELSQDLPSHWHILQNPENQQLAKQLHKMWGLCDKGEDALVFLKEQLKSKHATIRYQAAMELAKMGQLAEVLANELLALLEDASPMVRVAAAYAVDTIGKPDKARVVFVEELQEPANDIVQHYAVMGLENMGENARPALDAIAANRESQYEYTQRVATRTFNQLVHGKPYPNGIE